MAHNPLAQFEIKKLIDINFFDSFDISFTNSSAFMVSIAFLTFAYFCIALRSKQIVPSRLQVSVELLYDFIANLLEQNVGKEGKKYMPFIFSLFVFILLCNLCGMLPYSFTVTSHIAVTFTLAMIVFIVVTIIGFVRHGLHFLSIFLPTGTPWWLAPLMIIIELFAYLARPVSLSLRLAANMVAGHILLKVIAGFVVSLALFLKFVPIPIMVVLVGFEIFVAILQAYVFTILTCVYLNSSLNLH